MSGAAGVEGFSDGFDAGFCDAQLAEVGYGAFDVVGVGAAAAVALADVAEDFGEGEVAGELGVVGAGEVAPGGDGAAGGELQGQAAAFVNVGDEFAGVEIGQGAGCLGVGDGVGEADAVAAGGEAEDEAWAVLGAAPDPGIDAEAAVVALQAGAFGRCGREARVPHQGAVGEEPGERFGLLAHQGWGARGSSGWRI